MKIGIIGYGFVGQAVAAAHRPVDDVIYRDVKDKRSAKMEQFVDCHGVYLCLPSPQSPDGSCDTSALISVLNNLRDIGYAKTIIGKTTAPPSVYGELSKLHPGLVHCPEFLTQANHVDDYRNSKFFVIGGEKRFFERAREIIKRGVALEDGDFLYTDIKSAALFKYMMNCYLAMKVTFMNEFYDLARAHQIDWRKIKELAIFDPRIGHTHMDVPGPDGQFGWGGACFPKDVSAMIKEAELSGLDFDLIKLVDKLNREHRLKHVSN